MTDARGPYLNPTIGSLAPDDRVRLVCLNCHTSLDLDGTRMKALARPYRTLADVALSHVCGTCNAIGAVFELNQEPQP